MADKAIRLDAKQLQWLEAILLDDDAKDALVFLREVVQKQVKALDPVLCGPKTVDPHGG